MQFHISVISIYTYVWSPNCNGSIFITLAQQHIFLKSIKIALLQKMLKGNEIPKLILERNVYTAYLTG